MRTYKRGQRQI